MEEKKTLSWAKKRQIFIASMLFIVVALSLTALGFLLFSKQPSCFDAHQNGDETGIDCGGKCALVCSGIAKDPVIEFARLFKGKENGSGSSLYSAVAHIENQNNLIAKTATYTFKLYDANGGLITSREGSLFIPQRKSFPIFEGNIDTNGIEPAKVVFAFKDGILWEKSDYEEPKLSVEDEKLSGEKTTPRLVANIVNPGVRTVKNVSATAVLYDDAGNAVNSSKTIIDEIAPNQSVPVVYTWPYPLPESLHVCAQPVDVALVLDRSGSMASISSNPPQPLTDVKSAANYFVGQLNDKDQAAIISFANEASNPIDSPLNSSITSVSKAISAITIDPKGTQNTNITDGLQKAYEELSSPDHNSIASKIIVMLTDGVATFPTKIGDTSYPETSALSLANTIKGDGVSVFTIGLGKDLNKQFLTTLASSPEQSFFAPSAGELTGIYQTIGTKICKRGTSRIEISPLIPQE